MKIYIVEDDENIRDLLIYALNSHDFQTFGFEMSNDFFKKIYSDSIMPNLILLDIMLPDENGIDILKKLKKNKSTSKIPVILLSAKNNEYDKIKGLDVGADDYVTKPFSVLELISRINAVLRRSFIDIPKEILKFKSIELDIKKHLVKENSNIVILTYKEFELLQYMLENLGTVLSREKLIETVWGFDFEGESRTVDMHIKTLRQKLGDSGKLIETIRGVGYKIGD